MANTYKALSPQAEGVFAKGVFEAEFTPTEERDWLASGLLEIVPRKYRVLSDNYAAAAQGETFDGALLVENEAALIQGGHIERVERPTPKKKAS
jgi:hypothetical protein